MTTEQTYQRRLARGRRYWNFAERLRPATRAIERLQLEQWAIAVRTLELRAGETVLDLGCGAGNAFDALRAAVGETGRVVGIDTSPRMLAAARSRVADRGWDNVDVRAVDASRANLEPAGYDAAVAAWSLSTVPDLAAAVDQLHATLRPGGRVFVGDMHFGRSTRWLRAVYRAVTAANGDDVTAALRRRFASVEPVVDDRGRTLVPSAGRSWPPLAFVIARKAR
jgi:ubiquinone/menaquinone biosynthesis C-methylase UbiE